MSITTASNTPVSNNAIVLGPYDTDNSNAYGFSSNQLTVQVENIGGGLISEQSNDGVTWYSQTTLATGVTVIPVTTRFVRVRASGSGTPIITARLANAPVSTVTGGSGGGGSGGGPATIANGADVAEGSTTDAVPSSVSSSPLTQISAQKGILAGIGFPADAAATSSTSSSSQISLLKWLGVLLSKFAWGTAGGQTVEGTNADGAADAGNPLKVGAVYKATTPVYSDGQRTTMQVDANGNLRSAMILGSSNQPGDAIGNSQFTWMGTRANNPATQTSPFVANMYLNSSGSWDRVRGDTNGAWSKQPPLAGTDRSLTATTTAQTLIPANTIRSKFFIKNDSTVDVWINIGGTATAAAGTGNMKIAASGGYFEFTGSNSAISVIATANAAITAREF